MSEGEMKENYVNNECVRESYTFMHINTNSKKIIKIIKFGNHKTYTVRKLTQEDNTHTKNGNN